MILGEVFECFIAESPFSVMLRVLLEQSLPAEEVDALFEQQAQRQYQRELLFSTVVNLMSLVVCGILPSVNAAYQAKAKGIGVTIQSLYNKLNGIEPQIVEALLRHVVKRVQGLMEALGGTLPPLLEGYHVKIQGWHSFGGDRTPLGGTPFAQQCAPAGSCAGDLKSSVDVGN
jgi:hypothetical protein